MFWSSDILVSDPDPNVIKMAENISLIIFCIYIYLSTILAFRIKENQLVTST